MEEGYQEFFYFYLKHHSLCSIKIYIYLKMKINL